MQDLLNIAIVQTDIFWEDKAQNLAQLEAKLLAMQAEADIIILPEMFSTGFSMRPEALAETMLDFSVEWLRQMAKIKNAAIIGSLIIEENGHFYNRLFWVTPIGEIATYDKKHAFSMGGEHLHYTTGNEKLLVNYKGWKIAPFICYDLRFPTWCRNTSDYDILIFIASWPHRRSMHWRALLLARAIENQAYTFGVNRVGYDNQKVYHSGYSMAIDPAGDMLCELVGEEKIEIISISKNYLMEVRKRLPFLQDRD